MWTSSSWLMRNVSVETLFKPHHCLFRFDHSYNVATPIYQTPQSSKYQNSSSASQINVQLYDGPNEVLCRNTNQETAKNQDGALTEKRLWGSGFLPRGSLVRRHGECPRTVGGECWLQQRSVGFEIVVCLPGARIPKSSP